MRKFLVATILTVATTGCAWTTPGPGEEAVITRYPLLFGSGGVSPTPVATGRKFFLLTTHATIVNIQPQRVDMEFEDLMTNDGVPLDFHAVVTLQVINSVQLVKEFSPNGTIMTAFTKNLDQPFRTAVRDEVKKHGMNETAITVTAAEEIDTAATDHMARIIAEKQIPLRLLDLSLGRANPPDSVQGQRVETATQQQRSLTEQQRKLAEDQRKLAEESRAAADAAYNDKMNLTPTQYLQLESIKMWKEVCGGGKCTVLAGGGIMPTYDVK